MEPEANELPKGLVLGRDENIHIRITPWAMWNLTIPPPLRARHAHRHTSGHGLALIPNCHIPTPGSTTSRARSTTVAQYCPLWPPTTPSRLCFWELTRELPQWVTHHESALARYLVNFGVPTEPEASELPKGLVLGRDGNIHIRITPLGDVGSHNPPPLGARRPCRHTSGQGICSETKLSHPGPGPYHILGFTPS